MPCLFKVNVRWLEQDVVTAVWLICDTIEQAVLQVRENVVRYKLAEIGSVIQIAPRPENDLIIVDEKHAAV